MTEDPKPKTTGAYTIDQAEALRPLMKLMGVFSPKMRKQLREMERQMDGMKTILANLDQFARTYSPLGWVNYDRISTDVVAQVLAVSVDEGESLLTAYHLDPDNLRFLGYRFKTPAYQAWSQLFDRAAERSAAEDYLSAVPLILSIIDGICTTTTAKHPFSGGADAPVFDTIASGPGGLSDGFALLGSTRRKLDTSPISVPFRHGIVHGLNPNYGHAIVAAKAFNLLQASVDYFDRRRDEAERLAKAAEEQKPADWKELGRGLAKNAETKKRLDSWKARPSVTDAVIARSGTDYTLDAGSPEAAATDYLSLLATRNFGALAKMTLDYPKRPIGYRAGRIREDLKQVTVTSWTITAVEDTAAAMSDVAVEMSGTMNGQLWTGSQRMRLMYADEDNDPQVRGLDGASWIVMPDFVTSLWVTALRAAEAEG